MISGPPQRDTDVRVLGISDAAKSQHGETYVAILKTTTAPLFVPINKDPSGADEMR